MQPAYTKEASHDLGLIKLLNKSTHINDETGDKTGNETGNRTSSLSIRTGNGVNNLADVSSNLAITLLSLVA